MHVISYKPTDLSLLEGFLKNFSFEDFHNCHEICPNGGHELASLLLTLRHYKFELNELYHYVFFIIFI